MHRVAARRLAYAGTLCALAATPALAEPTGGGSPVVAPAASLAPGETGAFCTRYGCLRLPGSPLATATGFGLAVVAAGWISRRRRAR